MLLLHSIIIQDKVITGLGSFKLQLIRDAPDQKELRELSHELSIA